MSNTNNISNTEVMRNSTVGGFRVTIVLNTDDITDLLAFGQRLREAEAGDGEAIDTIELATLEVGHLIGAEGAKAIIERCDVFAEVSDVACEPIWVRGY